MNKVIMMGRLTADPEIHHSSGNFESDVASYTLAVPRGRKGEVDYFRCAAFGKMADFSRKYLRKGVKIVMTGHLKTGSYINRDGKKVYTTDIVIDSQEFAESKAASEEYYAKVDLADDLYTQPRPDSYSKLYAAENELPF